MAPAAVVHYIIYHKWGLMAPAAVVHYIIYPWRNKAGSVRQKENQLLGLILQTWLLKFETYI